MALNHMFPYHSRAIICLYFEIWSQKTPSLLKKTISAIFAQNSQFSTKSTISSFLVKPICHSNVYGKLKRFMKKDLDFLAWYLVGVAPGDVAPRGVAPRGCGTEVNL